jgi:DNA mismatch endonuclease (patch repair protein)
MTLPQYQSMKSDYHVDPKRSAIMRAVPRSNSSAEVQVRRLLHRLGLRFRLHQRNLPGTPDIVLPRYKTVVFVHGCFWHRHEGCSKATMPKTRSAFWRAKFEGNVERDRRNVDALENAGWRVLVVWQCELSSPIRLQDRLSRSFQVRCR